jgi:hypothetical protein
MVRRRRDTLVTLDTDVIQAGDGSEDPRHISARAWAFAYEQEAKTGLSQQQVARLSQQHMCHEENDRRWVPPQSPTED